MRLESRLLSISFRRHWVNNHSSLSICNQITGIAGMCDKVNSAISSRAVKAWQAHSAPPFQIEPAGKQATNKKIDNDKLYTRLLESRWMSFAVTGHIKTSSRPTWAPGPSRRSCRSPLVMLWFESVTLRYVWPMFWHIWVHADIHKNLIEFADKDCLNRTLKNLPILK